MKNLICVMTATALFAVSCNTQSVVIKGSGKVAKGEFDISLDYTELSVDRGIRVVLVESETGVGTITADEKLLEHVSIVQTNGHVAVSYEPHISLNLAGVETVVTMPISHSLGELRASSAGRIEYGGVLAVSSLDVDVSSAARISIGVEAGDLTVNLSSAAHFSGNVAARNTYVTVSSAANCHMEGSSEYLDVETSSAAGFDGFGLACKTVDAEASSAGSIEVSVSEELDVEASSGARVRYRGAPSVVRQDVSSGGSAKNA